LPVGQPHAERGQAVQVASVEFYRSNVLQRPTDPAANPIAFDVRLHLAFQILVLGNERVEFVLG